MKTNNPQSSSLFHWVVALIIAPLCLGPIFVVLAATFEAGGAFLNTVPLWAWVVAVVGYLIAGLIAWHRGILSRFTDYSWRPVAAVALAAITAGTALALIGKTETTLIPATVMTAAEKAAPARGSTGELVANIVEFLPILFGCIVVVTAAFVMVVASKKRK